MEDDGGKVGGRPDGGASQEIDTSASKLVKAGVVGTLIYLSLAAIYVFAMWKDVVRLNPHDFADSLSGVFAPLALYWLVLGFFQQGDELRHSSRALYLQGEELAHSVEQQRQLVQASREQFEHVVEAGRAAERIADHDAQPRIVVSSYGSSQSHDVRAYTFSTKCTGPTCTNAKLTLNNSVQWAEDVFGEGLTRYFDVQVRRGEEASNLFVEVSYIDRRGYARCQKWTIPVINGSDDVPFAKYAEPQKVEEQFSLVPPE